MHRYAVALVVAAVLSAASSSAVVAQQGTTGTTEAMTAVVGSSVNWGDIQVPGFDPGLKIAVLSGNPDATGLYTLRLSFPDGYHFPPHWHPNAENLTVVSGTFRLAMGERADDSQLKSYSPGDYLYLPAKHPHFGAVQGPTVIQLHGEGPFKINLVQASSGSR